MIVLLEYGRTSPIAESDFFIFDPKLVLHGALPCGELCNCRYDVLRVKRVIQPKDAATGARSLRAVNHVQLGEPRNDHAS
jgi:hypothetical protein